MKQRILKQDMERSRDKTRGEIEAAICDAITSFEQEYMGRGPKAIHAFLIDALLVVRLEGVLTTAEQQLALSLPPEKGRDLLKQVRIQLIEAARQTLDTIVRDITGVDPCTLHYDISTRTGEEILVFVLSRTPACRIPSRK